MWNFNEVKSLSFRDGYVFRITFDDGTSGDVDFSEYIGRGPVFEPLRDPAFFRSARIENGTISWPNGADIAPETLYEKLAGGDDAAGIERRVSEGLDPANGGNATWTRDEAHERRPPRGGGQ